MTERMWGSFLAWLGLGWVEVDDATRWQTERETPYGIIQRWQQKEKNRYTGKVRWRNQALTRWREPRGPREA